MAIWNSDGIFNRNGKESGFTWNSDVYVTDDSKFIYEHDSFKMRDHDLKIAISDFIIGAMDSDNKAYDWFEPFHLLVDWDGTEIQSVPESESASIELPGVDGSIIRDTTYKDRTFTLMCYSEDKFTTYEKEEIKKKIAKILDSTKDEHKVLTVQATGTQFDVKYMGQAEVDSGPNFVRAKIPLHVDPYGHSLYQHELRGSGPISNSEGDAPLRVTHTITGPITNPLFSLGSHGYTWSGTIPSGSRLIISHENYTCYTIDIYGKKKNALQYLSGDFCEIPAGSGMYLNANVSTESKIVTTWSTLVLW